MKKKMILTALIVLVLAFTTAVAARPAQAANASQVSAGWMPFAGSLYDLQTNSIINLNGLVHITSRWNSVSGSELQLDIDANLPAAGVTVTTDSGIAYSAFGAGHSSVSFPTDPLYPTDPLIPTDPIRLIVPSFWLVAVGSDRPLPPNPILPPSPILPPNPIRPFTFAMQFDLVFSAAGVLDFDASTVQVTQLPPIDQQ
jgi:hypothetical protein